MFAAIGCASSSLSGGGCGSGALSGGFGSFATQNMPGAFQGNRVYEAAYVTVVGGTVSVIGGGKFANGAETAAFGYLFNYLAHGRDLSATEGGQVVDKAKDWVGTDYAPIGTPHAGPYAEMGVAADCSGSVCSIYGQAGDSYSYTTSRGFATAAAREGFPFRQLGVNEVPQAGDVALYPGHMSIYAGDGQIFSAHRTGLPFDKFPVRYFGKPMGYYRYQLPSSSDQ